MIAIYAERHTSAECIAILAEEPTAQMQDALENLAIAMGYDQITESQIDTSVKDLENAKDWMENL